MKILRLRLTNLNSLRGENIIDFTRSPLADSGLFAITGPTGAGKTTLLDAMTLALYGRVARYGKDPSPDAMMSRHTGECSAEVEFACASGTYRSVWQLQRARKKSDGKLQSAKRRIIELPAGAIIAESIKDSDTKILELTGLDYDRFLRSVLLAQGEFAAFLKAGAKERTELLQEVTGTEIYRDISQYAYRVCAEAEQFHAALLGEHQAVAVLNFEERAHQETTLDAGTRRLDELTGMLRTLAKRVADAGRCLEIEKDNRQLAGDQAAHDNDRLEAAPALARLEAHEKSAPYVADFLSFDRLSKEQENDTNALTILDAALTDISGRLQAAEDIAAQARADVVTEAARQIQLRALWNEVAELDKTLAIANEALRQVTAQQTASAKNISAIRTALMAEQAALNGQISIRDLAQTWLAEHAVDINLAAQLPEIQSTFARRAAAEESTREATEALSRHRNEITRLSAGLSNFEKKLLPLQNELNEKQIAGKSAGEAFEKVCEQLSPAEIETRRDQARERHRALNALAGDAAIMRARRANLAARRKDAGDTAAEAQRLAGICQNLQQRRDEIAKLLAAQRAGLSLAEKVQSLEKHRAALQAQKPCPLCGALDHPYIDGTDLPSDELDSIRREVSDTESAQKENQSQLTEAEKQHAAQRASEKRLNAECEQLAAENTGCAAAWKAAAGAYDLADQGENESTLAQAVEVARSEESRRIAQLNSARAAELALQNAREAFRNTQAELQQAKNNAAQQSALIAHARAQLPALESALAKHAQNAAAGKSDFATAVAGYATAPNDITDAQSLHESLKKRAQAYEKRKAEAQECRLQVETKQAKCDALSQQFTEAAAANEELLGKVTAAKTTAGNLVCTRREKFGERAVSDAQREAEEAGKKAHDLVETTRISAENIRREHAASAQEKTRLTRAVAARLEERNTVSARLRTGASATGFADEKSLRAAILPPADATDLANRRTQLDERRVTLRTRSVTLAEQRAQLPESAASDAPEMPAIQAACAAAENELGTVQGQLGETRAVLKNDDVQRARQAAVLSKIENAHRDYVRWDKLRSLIGSADGSLFARFAQGLTLDRLAVLANRHLSLLNPRYSIRRASGGEADDLELEIIDHYQADAVRPMRSLSGGESFLASLALALGLSELAGGRASIESLFIDEGFGSLDADTLEIAMSALENLQAKGKTIGVISHVPAMQERIPTQIKVTKESAGCSRVTVSS